MTWAVHPTNTCRPGRRIHKTIDPTPDPYIRMSETTAPVGADSLTEVGITQPDWYTSVTMFTEWAPEAVDPWHADGASQRPSSC